MEAPSNYKELLELFSIKGFRILALAYKYITEEEYHKINRNDSEKNLNFLGFLLFLNPLKTDSNKVILSLINSKINCKIISGDNINTTIDVGV